MNTQPIEKMFIRQDGILSVHSIWNTIQGEGPFVGEPATFVRLAGCNLQCPMCDTEYSHGRIWCPPEVLVEEASKHNPGRPQGRLVVITGGEPFRQNLGPAVNLLKRNGFRVQIETNGTLYMPGPWSQSTIVCSPKTPDLNEELRRYISSYKYVVEAGHIDKEDGLPLSVLGNGLKVARPPKNWGGNIYIQPLDSKDEGQNEANRKAAVEVCMIFGYTLCLQIHKIVGLD